MTDLVAAVKSDKVMERLKAVLPPHMPPEKFSTIMQSVIAKTPDLMSCDPASFLSAVVTCAQLGLNPTPGLHQAYFIPFRNSKKGILECSFIEGWRGLVALILQSGQVTHVEAEVVFGGDHFDWELGLNRRLDHKPKAGVRRAAANVTHVYAIARFKDGSNQFAVMDRSEVDAIRDRGRQNPVWNSDYAEMAKKTAIRRLAKLLPRTPELAAVLQHDGEDEIALPPSRSPQRILDIQIAAANEETENLEALRERLVEASKRIAARGGKIADIAGAVDTSSSESLRAGVNRADIWLESLDPVGDIQDTQQD